MSKNFVTSEVNQESQSGLFYRKRISSTPPKARLLLLHGVGSNERNLVTLSSYMPDDVEVLLLRAPLQITPDGFAWFQVSFKELGPVINAEQAESSRKQLLDFIQSQPELPTIIAGFSQGGILSASIGLSVPHVVAGFGLLSGRILPELETKIATKEDLQSIFAFIAHGLKDSKLPVSWAHKADAWLTKLDVAHQTKLYEMGHEIIAEEISDFISWIRKVLKIN